MFVKHVIFFKGKLFNHISDIHRNKSGQYLGISITQTPCFGAEENMILYSIEQILDQGNAQRNNSLRLKSELHWIRYSISH